MIRIDSDGSGWMQGQPADPIEAFIARLAAYPLDPTFEEYGNFVQVDPHGAKPGGYENGSAVYIDTGPLYPPGTVDFWGNFDTISAVFKIVTDEPAVIERLTAAIRANQQTPAYAAAHAAIAERKAFFAARQAERDAASRREAERRALAYATAKGAG